MSEFSTPTTQTAPPARAAARPKILGFVCEWSLGRTDLIHEDGSVKGLEHIKTIKIPCSGFVKPEWIQLGFENGAQGVFVLGCPLGDCHFNEGNYIISDRIVQLRKRLVGRKTIDNEERIAELYLGATEGQDFTGMLSDFSSFIAGLPELAPPAKKPARGAAGAAGAARPAAAATAPAAAKPAATEPPTPAEQAAGRIGPSPARTANTDAALQAPQATDTSGTTPSAAAPVADPAPLTNAPMTGNAPAAPAPAPAATPVAPVVPAPAERTVLEPTPAASAPSSAAPAAEAPAAEAPRKGKIKRWVPPQKDGDA
jgi:coenzyme F420-reducing hydrogenase delta subunit